MKSKSFIITAVMMLFLCLVITAPVDAGNKYHVGCIDALRGDVQIYKAARKFWIPAKKLIPLEESDIIKTGKVSFCRLLFDDGSAIRVEAGSELVLSTLKIEKLKEKKVQTYHMKINFGTILSVFNKARSRSAKFKVRTPIAVASVRGTDFAISVKENDETKIGLFDGELTVSNPDVEGEEIVLAPDQEANVSKGKPAQKQERLSRLMQKHKSRCQKLRAYAEKVREKLDKRENYLQDRISARDKKLEDRMKRLDDRLKGHRQEEPKTEEQAPAPAEEQTEEPVEEPIEEQTEEPVEEPAEPAEEPASESDPAPETAPEEVQE